MGQGADGVPPAAGRHPAARPEEPGGSDPPRPSPRVPPRGRPGRRWVGRLAVALLLTGGGAGCPGGAGVVDRRLVPALSSDPACAPETAIGRLTLTALLDPPTAEPPPVARVDLVSPSTLSDFPGRPAALRLVAETFDTRFLGRALLLAAAFDDPLGGGPEAPARPLLLPAPGPCTLADPELRLRPGGLAVPLPSGGLFLAGGLEAATVGGGEGELVASRGVAVLPGRGGLVVISPEGLLDRRYGASGVVAGGRALVLGGAGAPGELARDTFEVWNLAGGEFDREAGGPLCPPGRPCPGRFRPAAVPIGPEGPVLVVGGDARAPDASDEGSPSPRTPLAEVVLIDPRTGVVDADLDPLPAPLASPALHRLDDGTILLAGGRDAAGAWVPALARYDREARAFRDLAGAAFPPELTAFAPLPGARLLGLGGGRAAILDAGADPPVVFDVPLTGRLPDDPLRAAGTPEGTALVVGRREDRPAAVLLDPGRGSLEAVPARRLPETLVSLSEGTLVALDQAGAVAYRPSLRHPLDPPPESIRGEDRAWLAPAAAMAFAPGPRGALVADRAGARLVVPAFAATRFSATAILEGAWSVQLVEARPGDGSARRARLGAPGSPCRFPGPPRRLERRSRLLTVVDAQDRVVACPLPFGPEVPVRLSLEAVEAGATFDTLRLRR